MTRTLLLIAGASFVLAVACIAGAAALGFHHHGGWRPWDLRFGHGRHLIWSDVGAADAAAGASATKVIAWDGGDELDIEVPGTVEFTQAPGPGEISVTGPSDMVRHVVLAGSRLGLDDGGGYWGRVRVKVTAPAVRKFVISGADTLDIAGFDQDELDLEVSGSGAVTAKGRARATHIDISGDGQVDFGGLAVETASATISGAGRATLAPTTAADLHISGDGEIVLLTHPRSSTATSRATGVSWKASCSRPPGSLRPRR